MAEPARPNLASASELARALGVGRRTVYGWMEREGFPEPVARIGNARVWNIDAVREWAERATPYGRGEA